MIMMKIMMMIKQGHATVIVTCLRGRSNPWNKLAGLLDTEKSNYNIPNNIYL